jgi:hypothetical protein
MKRFFVFVCLLACATMSNVFCAATPKVNNSKGAPEIVNPKDQTDVYGIPTDTDEVEDEQEIESLNKKK